MSVTKVTKPYLTPDDAAAAYLAKTPMEFSSKLNRVANGGNGDGWVDVKDMFATFWENFASGKFDFRLKPKHVYKRGDVVRVRSVREYEERKHKAFSSRHAFFAVVEALYGSEEGGDYLLIDGAGTSQVTHVSDFEPVDIQNIK